MWLLIHAVSEALDKIPLRHERFSLDLGVDGKGNWDLQARRNTTQYYYVLQRTTFSYLVCRACLALIAAVINPIRTYQKAARSTNLSNEDVLSMPLIGVAPHFHSRSLAWH